MGYKSKGGKFFNNPAIGRQHDKDEAAGKGVAREEKIDDGEPGPSGHNDVHQVTMHYPDDPENPSPGQHHSVTRHADGSEDAVDHASADEMHQHVTGGEDHELGDADEDQPDGETEICPNCGAEMQGGECPNCGYSADKGAVAGQHEEEQDPGDHEYR